MEYQNKMGTSPMSDEMARRFKEQFKQQGEPQETKYVEAKPDDPVVVDEETSDSMPVVEITTFNLTAEQRARVIEGLRQVMTRVMSRVAGEEEIVVLLPEENEKS